MGVQSLNQPLSLPPSNPPLLPVWPFLWGRRVLPRHQSYPFPLQPCLPCLPLCLARPCSALRRNTLRLGSSPCCSSHFVILFFYFFAFCVFRCMIFFFYPVARDILFSLFLFDSLSVVGFFFFLLCVLFPKLFRCFLIFSCLLCSCTLFLSLFFQFLWDFFLCVAGLYLLCVSLDLDTVVLIFCSWRKHN